MHCLDMLHLIVTDVNKCVIHVFARWAAGLGYVRYKLVQHEDVCTTVVYYSSKWWRKRLQQGLVLFGKDACRRKPPILVCICRVLDGKCFRDAGHINYDSINFYDDDDNMLLNIPMMMTEGMVSDTILFRYGIVIGMITAMRLRMSGLPTRPLCMTRKKQPAGSHFMHV